MEKICDKSGQVIRSMEPSSACPVDQAKNILDAALQENCGKGVMCRDGLCQIAEIVHDITNGRGETDDLEMLSELLDVIKAGADCDLSGAAAEKIQELLHNQMDEWRMHIGRKRCRAGVCPGCKKAGPVLPAEGGARRSRRRGSTVEEAPGNTKEKIRPAAKPATAEKTTSDRPAAKPAAAGKTTSDRPAAKPAAAGKMTSDRPAAKSAAARKTTSGRPAAKSAAAEKTAAVKTDAGRKRTDRGTARVKVHGEGRKMKHMEADVVVIACGMSGLAALTQAQESLNESGGGVAAAFEKSGTSGGSANMGMALLAFESQLQKENMVNDFTKDDAFRFFMEYVHWRSNAPLVRRWFEQSAETIEWLQDKGVEFLGVFKYFKNSHVTQHMVKAPGSNKPSERSASIMNRILTEYAQEIGAEIYFNTPVKEILTGSQGQVRGVIATDENGEDIECLCNSVIVATGGIGNNVDMIYEHMGWKWGEDMFTFRIPGIDGDGLNMAWNIGARRANINMEVTYNTPGTTDIFKTLSEVMRQPNLMVNYQGKRFINEEIMDNTTFTGNSLLQQKGHAGFTIIDATIADYYKEHGLDYITYHHGIKTMDKWDEELDLYLNNKGIEASGLSMLHGGVDDQAAGQTNFWRFDSLEELCETTGINLKNLKKTIEEYNAMCNGSQRGYDWQFTKDHRFLKPLLKAPYYVARHFPSGYGSLGGLEVNENMEVLTDEFDPIPGLYACGNDTATIFADSYCFYNPGSTMSYAINSGRIAAKEAVAYMDSEEFIDPES